MREIDGLVKLRLADRTSNFLQGNGRRQSESDRGASELNPDGQRVAAELLGGKALGAGGGNGEGHRNGIRASVAGGRDGDCGDLLVAGGVAQRVTALVTVETGQERSGHLRTLVTCYSWNMGFYLTSW